jgi:hypothetical protein
MLAFAPDAPSTTPEVLTAVSAIPTARGYASPPVGVATSAAALADEPLGGALLLKLDGSTVTLAATSSDIYSLSGGSWSSIGTITAGTSRVDFGIFGNTMLAVGKATQLQAGASSFTEVADAPKASTMEVLDRYVLLGDCDDASTGLSTAYGDQPDRWWLSAYEDFQTWEPGSGATTGRLVDTPGPIVRHCRLGDEVVTYKARGIYLGRLDGSDAVLAYACRSTDVGCPARDAVVAAGTVHYFPGEDNFYAFDGSRPVPIGDPIREWFFGADDAPGRLNRQNISLIQALHDRRAGRIYWFYPPAGSDELSACVVYHYRTQRWGAFSLTVQQVLQMVASQVTIDGLDALYATNDDIPEIPFDSPVWTANTPVLAYFNADDELMSLAGAGGPMSLTTGDVGAEEVVALCDRVRPKFRTKPTAGTITGYTKMALGDTPTLASPSAPMNGDRFDVLQVGRYHSFAITFADQTELESLPARLREEGEE